MDDIIDQPQEGDSPQPTVPGSSMFADQLNRSQKQTIADLQERLTELEAKKLRGEGGLEVNGNVVSRTDPVPQAAPVSNGGKWVLVNRCRNGVPHTSEIWTRNETPE